VVDAQVVDARHGDLNGLSSEVVDRVSGHLERLHDLTNRAHCCIRGQLEGRSKQIPIEEHVQVLVLGDSDK
jgi:hypothetical protein